MVGVACGSNEPLMSEALCLSLCALLKWCKYTWQMRVYVCVCVFVHPPPAFAWHLSHARHARWACVNAWAALAFYVTVLHSSCSVLLLARIIRLEAPGKWSYGFLPSSSCLLNEERERVCVCVCVCVCPGETVPKPWVSADDRGIPLPHTHWNLL